MSCYIMRDRHGTYYFRRVFISPDGKRKEVRRSLRTKSYREANRRLPEVYMNHIQPPSFVTLKDAVEEYLTAIEGKVAAKTLLAKRSVLNRFLKTTGNKDTSQVSIEDCEEFKQELVAENKSTTTVILYLKDIQTMFNHASIGIDVKKIFPKRTLRQDLARDTLTTQEVNKVIDSLPDGSFRWIVLVAIHSGMRLGEITQLYTNDIIQQEGIWCFYVTQEREDQRIKTPSAERFVPLHKSLINNGFLTYVQSLPEGSRVFPDLKYSKLHGYSGGISRKFSKLLTDLGIKNPDRKVSAHSLRHFVATELKGKFVEESIVSQLLGHQSGNSITYQRYGKKFPVGVLKEIVDKVEL